MFRWLCCAGDPFGCSYKSTWGEPLTDICVDYWYTLQPGEKRYLADTGYSVWYYTARIEGDPSTTWGTSVYNNLRFQPCSAGDVDCFGWDEVRMWGPDVCVHSGCSDVTALGSLAC